MRQLNNTESFIFLAGAVMMVVGSAANIFLQGWAPYVFAMGALAFVLMQLKQRYEGNNLTIRRLRGIMIASAQDLPCDLVPYRRPGQLHLA